MKRVIILSLLLLLGMTVKAQIYQGYSSVGFQVGYGFKTKNATVGIDYRYNITDEIRLNPGLTYFVKDGGLSGWALDMNAHYVVPLGDIFVIYPLAGIDLSFWKDTYEWHLDHSVLKGKENFTRIGVNAGIGGEVWLTDLFTLDAELKYNLVKTMNQTLISFRVAYHF